MSEILARHPDPAAGGGLAALEECVNALLPLVGHVYRERLTAAPTPRAYVAAVHRMLNCIYGSERVYGEVARWRLAARAVERALWEVRGE